MLDGYGRHDLGELIHRVCARIIDAPWNKTSATNFDVLLNLFCHLIWRTNDVGFLPGLKLIASTTSNLKITTLLFGIANENFPRNCFSNLISISANAQTMSF